VSASGAVLDTLEGLPGLERVLALASEPPGEGRAAAARLAAAGIRARLVPDAAVALAMTEADALLVGADAVGADGWIVNKVGTLPALLAARERGVPAWCLCEGVKVRPTSLGDETGFPNEARGWPGLSPPVGVELEPRWFERAPPALLTGLITEAGPCCPARGELPPPWSQRA